MAQMEKLKEANHRASATHSSWWLLDQGSVASVVPAQKEAWGISRCSLRGRGWKGCLFRAYSCPQVTFLDLYIQRLVPTVARRTCHLRNPSSKV